MTNPNIARSDILRSAVDALFAQPNKKTLKQGEALNILAQIDGRRNDNVVALSPAPRTDWLNRTAPTIMTHEAVTPDEALPRLDEIEACIIRTMKIVIKEARDYAGKEYGAGYASGLICDMLAHHPDLASLEVRMLEEAKRDTDGKTVMHHEVTEEEGRSVQAVTYEYETTLEVEIVLSHKGQYVARTIDLAEVIAAEADRDTMRLVLRNSVTGRSNPAVTASGRNLAEYGSQVRAFGSARTHEAKADACRTRLRRIRLEHLHCALDCNFDGLCVVGVADSTTYDDLLEWFDMGFEQSPYYLPFAMTAREEYERADHARWMTKPTAA